MWQAPGFTALQKSRNLCVLTIGGGGAEKVGRSVSMEREVTQTITHCADSKYDEQDTLRGNFHSHHRILGH